MGDLKEAIAKVINNAVEIVPDGAEIPYILQHSILVPKHLMDQLMLVYNICFVEPENDLEFQAWRES